MVLNTLDISLKWFTEGYREKSVHDIWHEDIKRNTPFSTCYAFVLHGVIGQRAAYLLSGEAMDCCERRWKTNYLS
jgi:hypothetical protein